MLAFTAMISWGFYSAIIKKIGEWDYPTAAVTRRIYFYGMLFLIPVLMWQGGSWDVTVFKKPEIILNFLFLGVASLMFTFRGIPCLYYGSEVGFRRGAPIDRGPHGPPCGRRCSPRFLASSS